MNDPYVSCPYNPLHRVPRSRLQKHIVKCEQIHPKLKICPYNATHRYPAETIKAHIEDCPEKFNMEYELKPQEQLVQETKFCNTDPDYESWD